MVDVRVVGKTKIFQEFDEVENNYWFDLKQKKFLHNIDTFYYSIKFKNDFTSDSKDKAVRHFRKFFELHYKSLERSNLFDSAIDIVIPGLDSVLVLKPYNYAGWFKICLECLEYFDIFFAPVVPHSSDGGDSVTCECVVQIRSYMLWMYGVRKAYEMSFDYVKAIAKHFHLDIAFTQENRVDYAWHTNYLQNPAKFFNEDDFYRMRVDRFEGSLSHNSKKGSEGYEKDYIALGKRSDKVFIRIYLKSKEVVQQGYKPWFFKVWLFNGLINRYDMYCYNYAFLEHKWQKLDYGRLDYYRQYGRDKTFIELCDDILEGRVKYSADKVEELANILTPKVTLVMNVEFQTMRRHSKTYELLPFFDNTEHMTSKRIYDYFDNRKIICDYLTSKVFRLVELYDGTNNKIKTRRNDCVFWAALRRCSLTDVFVPEEDVSLVRSYVRKLNIEVMKKRVIKSAVTLGIYARGLNESTPFQDCIEALCIMNDNDMEDALRFKRKKIRQFNEDELTDVLWHGDRNNIVVFDKDTGLIYNEYSSQGEKCQFVEKENKNENIDCFQSV